MTPPPAETDTETYTDTDWVSDLGVLFIGCALLFATLSGAGKVWAIIGGALVVIAVLDILWIMAVTA